MGPVIGVPSVDVLAAEDPTDRIDTDHLLVRQARLITHRELLARINRWRVSVFDAEDSAFGVYATYHLAWTTCLVADREVFTGIDGRFVSVDNAKHQTICIHTPYHFVRSTGLITDRKVCAVVLVSGVDIIFANDSPFSVDTNHLLSARATLVTPGVLPTIPWLRCVAIAGDLARHEPTPFIIGQDPDKRRLLRTDGAIGDVRAPDLTINDVS